MKYINKFETTEAFEAAKEQLQELEHYIAYDAESDSIKLKEVELPILVYTTTSPNQTINLIDSGKTSIIDYIRIIETNEVLSGDTLTYEYTFEKGGDHNVIIKFKNDVTDFSNTFNNCLALKTIPSNLFSNNKNATSFDSTFSGCTNLQTIGNSVFEGCSSVTSFDFTFSGCRELTSIGNSVFEGCSAVTGFSLTFNGCTSLTSIPNGLFSTNTAVTGFTQTFSGCTNLTSIPSDLFSANTAVTSFIHTFNGCTSLTSIPYGLFSANTAVTNFLQTFYGCSGLNSIPSDLFSANTAVTNFSYTFSNCTSLTSSCPIDKDGTPIYNRSGKGKEGYAIVPPYSGCFSQCTKMADYAEIPREWGGGKTA